MSQGANVGLSEETTAGNYFVSNYPPYSFWNQEQVSQAHEALDRPPRPGAPLGIYVHIPFCRKRCHFCYFKVYTGKDSAEIDRYLDAVVRELTLYSDEGLHRRKKTDLHLLRRRHAILHFDAPAQPPGGRHEAPAALGPGRGNRLRVRAGNHHRRQAGNPQGDGRHPPQPGNRELRRADSASQRPRPRRQGDRRVLPVRALHRFPADQYRPDRGHGRRDRRELARVRPQDHRAGSPDSVTIYQMEVPFNTTISKEMRVLGQAVAPVANWPTKRALGGLCVFRNGEGRLHRSPARTRR